MNNKTTALNIFIFLVAILVFWFGVAGSISAVGQLESNLKAKKQSLDLEHQVIDKLNSISQVLDGQKSNVERLEQAVPSQEYRPELISMMENLANQNGLNLMNIDINAIQEAAPKKGEAVAQKPIRKLKVVLELNGTYSSFKSWLEAVEKNLRLMDISKISFAVKESKSSSGQVLSAVNPVFDFSVELNTYVLKK